MTTRASAILGLIALAAAADAAAQPIDVPLDGTRIRLIDTSGSTGRRTYVALRPGPDAMPFPDPRIMGAKAFIGPVGADPIVELDLPAGGWSGSPQRGFKFKSRQSTVITARLGSGRLRFSARGAGAYPLGDSPLGGIGVVVEIGAVRYCGFFGGAVTRDDGTRFQARSAPAPQSCPVLGTTTTTSTTSTSTTTTSSTSTSTTSSTLPACGDFEPDVVPSGSYRLSCFHCRVTGCALSCGCADHANPPSLCFNDPPYCVHSSLDLSTCAADTIGNDDGHLTCVLSSTTTTTTSSTTTTTIAPSDCGVYDANALPTGSYGDSCVECSVTGCTLDCLCPTAMGTSAACATAPNFSCGPTSLDLTTCVAGDIGNDGGQLTCPTTTGPTSCGVHAPNTLPSGSYEGSCLGCLVSGCILECRCPMASAPGNACFSIDPEVFVFCPSSAIDLNACGAGDIGNDDGNLRCPAP
jgi:hypothetical protein